MGKTVLFSPVGGTDPVSESNFRDGSLLHICRVYHPDKVYLYLSGEMLEHHKLDNRYCYCLEKLQEAEGFRMSCDVIERPDLKNVFDYDFFYREFYQLLSKIQEGMNESDELLLNIASGTPAMKSALLVMQQITDGSAKCIQVVTPDAGRNIHGEIENYDVKAIWELNEDNEKPLKNRCLEVVCPSLVSLKKLEIIKEQVSKYDYHAAISVVNTLPAKSYGRLKAFLNLAKARQDLDADKVKKLSRDLHTNVVPVTGDGQALFEYALNLENKLKRREYSDFIRGITPLLVDLFELVLRDSCSLDISSFIRRDQNGSFKWDEYSLSGTRVKSILDAKYKNGFDAREKYIQSDHLVKLITYISNDRTLKGLVLDLRSIEETVRNMAAHEIVSITNAVIKDRTGFFADEIMEMIKKVFAYIFLNNEGLDWNSYQKMNDQIEDMISEEIKRDMQM